MQHYFTSCRQNQNVFQQLNCDAAYLLFKITSELHIYKRAARPHRRMILNVTLKRSRVNTQPLALQAHQDLCLAMLCMAIKIKLTLART